MIVRMFNIWYFVILLLCVGIVIGMYYLLRGKSEKTQRMVLFSLLIGGVIFHFAKMFFPPYSTNEVYKLRDIWFINICGANIFVFPFIFLSNSDRAKDYMYVLGIVGGGLAILYPTEPIIKTIENPDYLDVIRYYYHHLMLLSVPLLEAMLGLHRPSLKRVLWGPTGLMLLMLFIMVNQVLQSELGFVPLRNGDFFEIGYRNNSLIWGPGEEGIASIFTPLCPKFFTKVPVGEHAGETKYWPWFWMICPVYVYFTVLGFLLIMIFDFKTLKEFFINVKARVKNFKLAFINKKNE